MKNVAIIGAGQLGSRHLQALALHEEELNIYIVDPSEESLVICKKRYDQVDQLKTKNIYAGNYVDILPKKIDFAIIATTSVQRLAVLKQLLSHSKVRYLLIEKFLFPEVTDYKEALTLISDNNVEAYVNCVRRTWPIYQEIKKTTSTEPYVKMTVKGSNWNMASNSIHFLDLFFYLSRAKELNISANALDKELLTNKRDGYMEVSGTLRGISQHGQISLTSDKLGSSLIEITIESNKYKHIIFEGTGKSRVYIDNKKYRTKDFNVLKQSELTHIIFKQLIENNTCDLVPFEESVNHHLFLLKALNEFLGDRDGVIT